MIIFKHIHRHNVRAQGSLAMLCTVGALWMLDGCIVCHCWPWGLNERIDGHEEPG